MLVLLTVLSLPPPVGMADFDSLKLILNRSDLVLEPEVLHLHFAHADDVLNFCVILHGHVLRKRQVTHELSLQLVHPLHVSLGL